MKETCTITSKVRRRFVLGKQGLWPVQRWDGQAGTASALREIESVQVDPLSIVANSHDIVLWGRIHGYHPQYLQDLIYKEHKFFEYGGNLRIYPIEELPYWRIVMNRYKKEKRWESFAQENPDLLNMIRERIRSEGPLQSKDFEGKSSGHYRSGKETGVALYYLWLTGELMILNRQGKARIYDFIENIVPQQHLRTADEKDAVDFFIHKSISQHGLINEREFRDILKSAEHRSFTAKETKTILPQKIESGLLSSVRHEDQNLYLLPSDLHIIDDLINESIPDNWLAGKVPLNTAEVRFLSPLEMVSARGRAKEIFDFEYIWEIYKPTMKRKYGPYTMPVLFGDQLVARMDAKVDRKNHMFIINGFWFEEWFTPNDEFLYALANGLQQFSAFLEVTHIHTNGIKPASLQSEVNAHLSASGMTID